MGKTVMIVDDNKDIVSTLQTIMQKQGYTTPVAYNGQELLESIEGAKPDIILLDVMMPGLTTREILEALKTSGFGEIKIILVTVIRFSKQEIEETMKEYKIVDYITKPFDINDIIRRVKRQLAGSGE